MKKLIKILGCLILLLQNLTLPARIIDGEWIVTKCISSEASFAKVELDEIRRNLGCYFKVNDHSIWENLNGGSPYKFNLTILTKYEKTSVHFNDDNYFVKSSGYKKDSILIAFTNKKGWLEEFYILNENEIVVSMDGFYLFLNKPANETQKARIISDKLIFYTDETAHQKFKYYAVKNELILILVKKNDKSFVKYSNKDKNFYGWVDNSSVQKE